MRTIARTRLFGSGMVKGAMAALIFSTALTVDVMAIDETHTSKFSEKPVPLQSDLGRQLWHEDILNYEGLVKRIREQAAQDQPSPGKQIWSVINPAIKPRIESAGDAFDQGLKYDVQLKLNSVLRRRDFYSPEAFAGVDLGEDKAEIDELIAKGIPTLGPNELARLNRLLIQRAYPDLIVPTTAVAPFPTRPEPLLEIGQDFLGTGNIRRGFVIPTGAVWQPYLVAFGTFRTGLNYFDPGNQNDARAEWANRLDLFFNLYLTPSERIVVGFRPIDHDGQFMGYYYKPDEGFGLDNDSDGWHGDLDWNLSTFFIEGDIGEIFPNLDANDYGQMTDIGFSVGRQPIFFQDGLMVNDNLDAVGITRNSLQLPHVAKTRLTFLYAWDNLDRGNGLEDKDAQMFGLFTYNDLNLPYFSTVDFDMAFLNSPSYGDDSDSANFGLGAVQRFGRINTTFRINHSHAFDEEGPWADSGTLLFTELSMTQPYSDNLFYLTGFWAIDEYTMLSRDPEVGGPLGRAGILFESAGLGRYGAALSPAAQNVAGGALGYQIFLDVERRKQLTLEAAGRIDTEGELNAGAVAVGARYQQAIGQRMVFRADTFINSRDETDKLGFGGRVELQYNF